MRTAAKLLSNALTETTSLSGISDQVMMGRKKVGREMEEKLRASQRKRILKALQLHVGLGVWSRVE